MTEPLLRVSNLEKKFPIQRGMFKRTVGQIHAVDGISFDIAPGETLGLVGESGCGKSTTARLILRLLDQTSGEIYFDGKEIHSMSREEIRGVRKDMQIVFQDPYASLNPRMTVRQIVAEPLIVHGMAKDDSDPQVDEMIELCGLSREFGNRYPHEFSGGQRQRVGIARALALDPALIVLDEPVSALDVSIQAGVVNLFGDLQKRLGMSYVFIAHDLSVVRHIADRVAVMYLGKIVEIGDKKSIYEHPTHPYTKALLSAVPVPNPTTERSRSRIMLEGDVPSPVNPPSGCRFRTRCWKATDLCASSEPQLVVRPTGQLSACHFPE